MNDHLQKIYDLTCDPEGNPALFGTDKDRALFGEALAGLRQDLDRLQRLEAALKPLADIADEWVRDALDESRPGDWGGSKEYAERQEIYWGRGGKPLLRLADAFRAKEALQ